MKLPQYLKKIHEKVVEKMSNCSFVENVLIAKITEDDGQTYDCIYCTIIRNAVLFGLIGFLVGYGVA